MEDLCPHTGNPCQLLLQRVDAKDAKIAELENDLALSRLSETALGSELLSLQQDCISGVKRIAQLEGLIREMLDIEAPSLSYPNPYPFHCHERPGIWDGTGKVCVECALWKRAREAIGSPAGERL